MKKFTTEWWKKFPENIEFKTALAKISFILQYTGKWNRRARVLEVQCGLGSMPQFMYDNGYDYYRGTDNNENVSKLWENTDILKVAEPDDTGFGNKEFHLVCWYSMDDGRIEQDRIPAVLDEMERIGHGVIIVKPFSEWEKSKANEFLSYMLENNWVCFDHNPVSWHYMFFKG